MSLYLPVFGRCFSSRPSSLSTTPPVTVLVVVFCVPMPISSVSALTCPGTNAKVVATSKGNKPESLDAGATLMGQILSNQTMLRVAPCARELPRPQVAGQLGGEQVDGIDTFDFAIHVPSGTLWPARDGRVCQGDG